ncbi:MAG TPA: response regulator [Polyangia bacterium]|nr:response regulator [Polyangia bacterium]
MSSSAAKLVSIVEDDDATREGLVEFLRNHQFAVLAASTSASALEMLHRGLEPSVILLDLMMPGLNGWDFRRLQMADARLQNIPVVVMTAMGVASDSTRAQLGEVTWLTKPFDVDALVKALTDVSPRGDRPRQDFARFADRQADGS